MKHKTRKKIAAFIVAALLLAAAALVIAGLSSPARANEKPWKVRINDPCRREYSWPYASGEVADYVGCRNGMVRVELTDGREYTTHWANVLFYKD